jgi:hypothetical protein
MGLRILKAEKNLRYDHMAQRNTVNQTGYIVETMGQTWRYTNNKRGNKFKNFWHRVGIYNPMMATEKGRNM